VATVDSNGLVKAVAKGDATITATSNSNNNVKGTCDVKILVPIESISLTPASKIFSVDEKYSINYQTLPLGYTTNKVRFESDDEGHATVDSNGVVTAKGLGPAVITIYADDGVSSATATFTADVKFEPVKQAETEP
jgi:uncharacterized protein YjdB